MPIRKPWFICTNFEIEERVSATANGVYEIADAYKNTIYIGRGEIRNRLQNHGSSSRSEDHIPGATWFRFEETPYPISREEELLLEFKNTHGRLPKYNDRVG